jgi:hypothetical protein
MKSWIFCIQDGTQSIDEHGKEQGADQIEPVEKNQFGKFCKIGDEPVIRGKVPAACHPADMGPKETFMTWRMNIDFLVGVGMVMSVDCRPPEGTTLDAKKAEKGKEELDGTARFVGLMAEIAVIDAGDEKHPYRVEQCADSDSHGTPTNPEDSKASKVQNDERYGATPIHAFGKCAGGLESRWKIVRINEANQ